MRKAIENTSAMPIYVNGVMIQPGETRHFEDDQIPPEHRDAPAPVVEEAAPDHLAEIAGMKADIVLPILPDLSAEDLARLQLLEMEGKARKTVLEAIAAEGLKRASGGLENSGSGEGEQA